MSNISKIKELLIKRRKEIIIFILIFLISSLSFGLGYLVNKEFSKPPIIIEKNSEL